MIQKSIFHLFGTTVLAANGDTGSLPTRRPRMKKSAICVGALAML